MNVRRTKVTEISALDTVSMSPVLFHAPVHPDTDCLPTKELVKVIGFFTVTL